MSEKSCCNAAKLMRCWLALLVVVTFGAVEAHAQAVRDQAGIALRPFVARYKAGILPSLGRRPEPIDALQGEMEITTRADCQAWTTKTDVTLATAGSEDAKPIALHWVEEWREAFDGKAASFSLQEEADGKLVRRHRGQIAMSVRDTKLVLLDPQDFSATLPGNIRPRIRQLTELLQGIRRGRRDAQFSDFDAASLNVYRVNFRVGPAIDAARYGTWTGDKLSDGPLWTVEEHRAPMNNPDVRPVVVRLLIGRDVVPVRVEQALGGRRLVMSLRSLRWLASECRSK